MAASSLAEVTGGYRRRTPFDLNDPAAYAQWRDTRLERHPAGVADLLVPIRDPARLTATERDALLDRCARANMAIYVCERPERCDKESLARLGLQLGLRRLDHNLCADGDSISSLQVMQAGRHQAYIPYTNRPLNWHTDGYYNSGIDRISAFLLHCVRPAAAGGENRLLDPEIVYILMRDADPEAVAAMSHPAAMTVPPNEEDGSTLRDARGGPVFSTTGSGHLHMRYTARTRSIEWRDDAATTRARRWLGALLESDLPYIFTHRLEAGQGLICNNVLHTRSAFDNSDAQTRLLYRARYYDRVNEQAPIPAGAN